MFKIIFLILILVLNYTIVSAAVGPGRGLGPVSAAQFIPGNYIDMTGSNASVRFDIASELYSSDAFSPYLISGSRDFDGAFYGSGIGWVMFSTGVYQVSLDCGAQSLSTLTANCTLSGTGWSELI